MDWGLTGIGIKLAISRPSNELCDDKFERAAYRLRNPLERLFGRLRESDRVATRSDKLARTYLVFRILTVMRPFLKLPCQSIPTVAINQAAFDHFTFSAAASLTDGNTLQRFGRDPFLHSTVSK